MWSLRAQVEFEQYAELPEQSEVSAVRAKHESSGDYRISPLVSDVETWRHRIAELHRKAPTELRIFKGRGAVEYGSEFRVEGVTSFWRYMGIYRD